MRIKTTSGINNWSFDERNSASRNTGYNPFDVLERSISIFSTDFDIVTVDDESVVDTERLAIGKECMDAVQTSTKRPTMIWEYILMKISTYS